MTEVPELSEAGAHFGRALCLSDDRVGLGLSQLTPEERNCVERTGLGWQGRVEERLSGSAGPPEPDLYLRVMRGQSQVGSLRLVDGAVTLCLPQQACELLGHGMDAVNTADGVLQHMGFRTEEMR